MAKSNGNFIFEAARRISLLRDVEKYLPPEPFEIPEKENNDLSHNK
jgi:hypothetical protein